MAYDEDADHVIYRRDRRIRWPKKSHAIHVRGIPVLNPVVTMLFKLNKSKLEDKDCQDVQVMIDAVASEWRA